MLFFAEPNVLTADTSNSIRENSPAAAVRIQRREKEQKKQREKKKLNKLIAVRRELADKRIYSEVENGSNRNETLRRIYCHKVKLDRFGVWLFLFRRACVSRVRGGIE